MQCLKRRKGRFCDPDNTMFLDLGTDYELLFWANSSIFTNKICAHFQNYIKLHQFFKKFIYLINIFLAAQGLHCCMWAFSSCGQRGLLFVVVHGILIAVACLVVEHGLQTCGLRQLWHVGSVVVAHGLQSAGSVFVVHGLSCSMACGIFPDQGLNPCPLRWQADS